MVGYESIFWWEPIAYDFSKMGGIGFCDKPLETAVKFFFFAMGVKITRDRVKIYTKTTNLQCIQVAVFIHPEICGNDSQLFFGSVQTNKNQEGTHAVAHHTQQ